MYIPVIEPTHRRPYGAPDFIIPFGTIHTMDSTHFAIAFLAGLIPALFWLWFWLREDKAHPEPRALIATSFIACLR